MLILFLTQMSDICLNYANLVLKIFELVSVRIIFKNLFSIFRRSDYLLSGNFGNIQFL